MPIPVIVNPRVANPGYVCIMLSWLIQGMSVRPLLGVYVMIVCVFGVLLFYKSATCGLLPLGTHDLTPSMEGLASKEALLLRLWLLGTSAGQQTSRNLGILLMGLRSNL